MSKRKISIKQAFELLSQAGVQVAEIVADEAQADKDVNTDALLTELDAARTKIIRPQIEQEIKNEAEKGVDGRIAGTVRAAVKRKTGLKDADLKDLSEDQMIEKGIEHMTGKLGADTEGLRQQIKDLTETHTATLTAKEKEWQDKVAEAEARYQERDIEENLLGIVKTIPRTGGNELVQTRNLKQFIRDNYTLVLGPDGKTLELRDKANKELLAYNESKTKPLMIPELAQKYFEDMGVLAKDNRGVNPNDAMRRAQEEQQQQRQGQQQQGAVGFQPANDNPEDPTKATVDAMAAWANQTD